LLFYESNDQVTFSSGEASLKLDMVFNIII
jgi:hypothetical protein